jgi:hypothetical protein
MSTGFNQVTRVDDLSVKLNIDPGQAGINTFTATVQVISSRQPVTDAQDVSLEFTSVSGMVPSNKAPMANLGNGIYQLKGGYLSMPEKWHVQVVVVRQGIFDAYASYQVDISHDSSMSQTSAKTIPWRKIAAGLIVATAFSYVFTFRTFDRNIPRWIGLGLAPGLALSLVGLLMLI